LFYASSSPGTPRYAAASRLINAIPSLMGNLSMILGLGTSVLVKPCRTRLIILSIASVTAPQHRQRRVFWVRSKPVQARYRDISRARSPVVLCTVCKALPSQGFLGIITAYESVRRSYSLVAIAHPTPATSAGQSDCGRRGHRAPGGGCKRAGRE